GGVILANFSLGQGISYSGTTPSNVTFQSTSGDINISGTHTAGDTGTTCCEFSACCYSYWGDWYNHPTPLVINANSGNANLIVAASSTVKSANDGVTITANNVTNNGTIQANFGLTDNAGNPAQRPGLTVTANGQLSNVSGAS